MSVQGRYIRIEQSRVVALNLAQIYMYSYSGGPNILTPSTVVTMSSDYWGSNSGVNLVNQSPSYSNMAHTGEWEVPWIEVDLGTTRDIFSIRIDNRRNCCQDRIIGSSIKVLDASRSTVYVSAAITSSLSSYTFNPSPTASYLSSLTT
jgi:hypothetical protein